ncbi:MAG TPA: hypothetical protein VIL85_12730 [Thermomicrobiales bacterium]|jgi:hypothetical protein
MARATADTGTARRRQRRGKVTLLDRLPAPLRRWLVAEVVPFARTLTDRSILATLALTVVGLIVLYQLPQTHRVDVGVANGRDGFYLRDFFAKETVGDTTFRWIGGRAAIVLPGASGNSQWQLNARIAAPRPPGVAADTPPATLAIFADGQSIARFAVSPGFGDYTFQFAREALPLGDLTIRFEAATFSPPGGADDRLLGVQIADVTLAPIKSGFSPLIPPLLYIAALLALLGGLAGLFARLGVPSRVAAAIVAIVALGVLAGQATLPDVTAFYLPHLLMIVAVLIGVLLVLRPLFRRICAAGGVALSPRDEQVLLGIFVFGAGFHLAGVFFPDFRAHDLIFQANRMRDIMAGRFLLVSLVDQEGVRPTPYSPAVYILLAPLAKLFGGPELMLRLWMPIIDATSALLVFYLLRRCRVPDPAPILAAFFTTILAVTSQMLWWGFFSNQFGQWATLLALTVIIGHWGELGQGRLFALLVPVLALPLLSHPSAFVMLCGLVPLLAIALAFGTREWRQGGLVILAFGLALLLAYLIYYRHFTALALDYARNLSGDDAVRTADDAPGWEWNYIRLRIFSLPLGLYVLAAITTPVVLLRERQRALGWGLLAVIATFVLFAAVHVVSGLWVRYFVFLGPALAIGAGIAVAWLLRYGRWGRGVAYAALAYGTVASLVLWFTISIGGGRSIYP